ncbi:MAG TPA: hypothetical protein VGI50_01380 [Solirubrobacteraceae bacterium]
MRKLVVAVFSALALAAVIALPASANTSSSTRRVTSQRLALSAKITSFRATAAGVVANGTLTGKLSSGTGVSRDSAPVRFAVVAASRNQRCNVITLRLAPLDLELLGVQVQTSYISLDVYALRGRVLGDLFCALAHAKVSFPKVARDLNSRLGGRSMQVLGATDSMPAHSAAQPASCQVLKLVLGPLHLDLLGLNVDLYGQTKANPVVVTIDAVPSQGLLGQLLCGLAGGTGVNNLSGLQSLLGSLGLNLSTTQLQNLLNQLGISNLSAGLTELDLNRILQALGLGSTTPSG